MKKLKKALSWFVFNGAYAALVYFGMFAGVAGAANLVIFLTVLLFLISLISTNDMIVEKLAEDPEKHVRSVPVAIDRLFDFSIMFAFAWSGHLVLATLYAIHYGCYELLFDKITAHQKKTKENKEIGEAEAMRNLFSGGVKKVGDHLDE